MALDSLPTLTPGIRLVRDPDEAPATDPKLLRVTSSWQGTTAVVTAVGELDLATTPLLHEVLMEAVTAGAAHVVLDFDGLDYLDSSGIALMVALYQRTTADGSRMTVVCNSLPCIKVLHLTGLESAFTFAPSVAAAVATAGRDGSSAAETA